MISGTDTTEPIIGSALYRRTMEWANRDNKRRNIMHEVWDVTPWMIDTYTGREETNARYVEIVSWCRDRFGKEACPIIGKTGKWQSGTTIDGWTWMGFASKEMLGEFCSHWVCR